MDLGTILESDFDDAVFAGYSDEELAGIIEAAPASAKKALARKVKNSAKR